MSVLGGTLLVNLSNSLEGAFQTNLSMQLDPVCIILYDIIYIYIIMQMRYRSLLPSFFQARGEAPFVKKENLLSIQNAFILSRKQH